MPNTQCTVLQLLGGVNTDSETGRRVEWESQYCRLTHLTVPIFLGVRINPEVVTMHIHVYKCIKHSPFIFFLGSIHDKQKQGKTTHPEQLVISVNKLTWNLNPQHTQVLSYVPGQLSWLSQNPGIKAKQLT